MKYIKFYEQKKVFNPLVIGMMYKHNYLPVCYLGHNNLSAYPLLALILWEDSSYTFNFIEWVDWMENENQLKPMNMTIEEYIIEKKIIGKTLNAFIDPHFSSGGCKESDKKINLFLDRLLNNKSIQIALPIEREYYEMKNRADKYNL